MEDEIIDRCIANDRPTWTGPLCAGLPLVALRSLATQGSTVGRNGGAGRSLRAGRSCLTPFLWRVNEPAVFTDQAVVRTALRVIALGGRPFPTDCEVGSLASLKKEVMSRRGLGCDVGRGTDGQGAFGSPEE